MDHAPFGIKLFFPSARNDGETSNLFFAARIATTSRRIPSNFPKCFRIDDFAIIYFVAETPAHIFTISYEMIKGIEPRLCLAAATRADVEKCKATILTRTPIGALVAYHRARHLDSGVFDKWKDRSPRHYSSPFPTADRIKCVVVHPLTFFREREQNQKFSGPLGPPLKDAISELYVTGLRDGPKLSALAIAIGEELPVLKGRLTANSTSQGTLYVGALDPRAMYNKDELTNVISVDFDTRTMAMGRRRGAAVSSATYEDNESDCDTESPFAKTKLMPPS